MIQKNIKSSHEKHKELPILNKKTYSKENSRESIPQKYTKGNRTLVQNRWKSRIESFDQENEIKREQNYIHPEKKNYDKIEIYDFDKTSNEENKKQLMQNKISIEKQKIIEEKVDLVNHIIQERAGKYEEILKITNKHKSKLNDPKTVVSNEESSENINFTLNNEDKIRNIMKREVSSSLNKGESILHVNSQNEVLFLNEETNIDPEWEDGEIENRFGIEMIMDEQLQDLFEGNFKKERNTKDPHIYMSQFKDQIKKVSHF